MSRQRWFCCLCGAMTARASAANGRALCTAHSAVALDEVPADPLVSLPPMKSLMFDGLAGFDLSDPPTRVAIRKIAALQEREDANPTSGTEA